MSTSHGTESIRPEVEASFASPQDEPGLSRRRLIRRSALGFAGVSLTALLGGCGWGGDDDEEEDTVGPDNESDGLEGAEDPEENPGVDEESGINDDVVGNPDDEFDAAATDEADD